MERRYAVFLDQGADCCGQIVAVGRGGETARIGQRVIIRSCMRANGFDSPKTVWLGSDVERAFAQFVKAPADEAFSVTCDWIDAALAAIPCAYGAVENMVARAGMRSLPPAPLAASVWRSCRWPSGVAPK